MHMLHANVPVGGLEIYMLGTEQFTRPCAGTVADVTQVIP